jgi:5-methylcytosine-specific restriction protein A
MDAWDANGVFHYYGAGQVGDMQFRSGNAALRDHALAGEEVHVFEQEGSELRYVGQFVCADYYQQDRVPDGNGDPRRAIVFELVPLDAVAEATETDRPGTTDPEGHLWSMPLGELRDRTAPTTGPNPDPGDARRRAYARSRSLRVYVLRRANGLCEGCGHKAPFETRAGRPYLEPHHTRLLADGGPDDYHHVIALCPTCHRRVHHGADGDDYNAALTIKLAELEPLFGRTASVQERL